MFWSCFPIFQGVRADLVANFYLKSVDFGPVEIMHFTVKMVNLVIFFKNMDFKIQRWLMRKIIIFTKLVRKLDLYLKKRLLLVFQESDVEKYVFDVKMKIYLVSKVPKNPKIPKENHGK